MTRSGGFFLCLDADRYPASLVAGKIYRSLSDPAASRRGFVRVTDESGEDYLFEKERFVAVKLPRAVQRRLVELQAA